MKDHYTALGLAPDAEQEVVKAAFRALAKKYHPDTTAAPAAAKARFREVNEAHTVLGDPTARARYDHQLAAQREQEFGSSSHSETPDESSDTVTRQRPSTASGLRRGAAALFVFGFLPAVLILLGMIIGMAIIEFALGR